MTATADKARYFLEQSVPELKEYERKGIFEAQEITAIARKRSDFEHKINARGSNPADYSAYAAFEINVDKLRRKRVQRLRIKSITHNGQRRIFFVYDRGTRKFPGDIELWLQSIEFAKQQKSFKKLAEMFTTVLRLHPTKSELWIRAASFAMGENGDMTTARNYMQRGLRFCKNQQSMWIAYAKLEMAYIVKIYARRQILGLGEEPLTEEHAIGDETDDILRLPRLTRNDIELSANGEDANRITLNSLDDTPIMSGAIPIAIFDAAMQNFKHRPDIAHEFFDAIRDFVPATSALKVLQHIIDALRSESPKSWHTYACTISMCLLSVETESLDSISGLRSAIAQMTEGLSQSSERLQLTEWCTVHLTNVLKREDLADDFRKILSSKLRSLS